MKTTILLICLFSLALCHFGGRDGPRGERKNRTGRNGSWRRGNRSHPDRQRLGFERPRPDGERPMRPEFRPEILSEPFKPVNFTFPANANFSNNARPYSNRERQHANYNNTRRRERRGRKGFCAVNALMVNVVLNFPDAFGAKLITNMTCEDYKRRNSDVLGCCFNSYYVGKEDCRYLYMFSIAVVVALFCFMALLACCCLGVSICCCIIRRKRGEWRRRHEAMRQQGISVGMNVAPRNNSINTTNQGTNNVVGIPQVPQQTQAVASQNNVSNSNVEQTNSQHSINDVNSSRVIQTNYPKFPSNNDFSPYQSYYQKLK